MRGVCFEKMLEHYKKIAESKSSVKLTNFQIRKKRQGHPVDIIIRKKTALKEVSAGNLSFDRLATPTQSSTIGSLLEFKPGQLLTLKGMVSNLQPTKEVTNKATN